jgi:hypothetical protein
MFNKLLPLMALALLFSNHASATAFGSAPTVATSGAGLTVGSDSVPVADMKNGTSGAVTLVAAPAGDSTSTHLYYFTSGSGFSAYSPATDLVITSEEWIGGAGQILSLGYGNAAVTYGGTSNPAGAVGVFWDLTTERGIFEIFTANVWNQLKAQFTIPAGKYPYVRFGSTSHAVMILHGYLK